jgi:hypothetical protein
LNQRDIDYRMGWSALKIWTNLNENFRYS